ncbi:hypothetical protein DPMN_157667 [Dreissena polymorpha]|uniref:Uncharacterized protein n=1 Tax=Dreissena polymorpha TaxID=45954 RepID=A0A9D4EFV2_DREPO|nr:hypothetical protein DPMN_157667 [Dreissena polymorpha]
MPFQCTHVVSPTSYNTTSSRKGHLSVPEEGIDKKYKTLDRRYSESKKKLKQRGSARDTEKCSARHATEGSGGKKTCGRYRE